MTLSKSLDSYHDCDKHFNDALASERGIVIECGDKGQAVRLRTRLNFYRSLVRKQNLRVYPEDHPMYGSTMWEGITCRIDPAAPNELILVKGSIEQTVKVRAL
jgi:hypothetical protein